MRVRSVFVKVKTPIRWEYITDEFTATPNPRKAAIFPNGIQALRGLQWYLRDGERCNRFEIREARFGDVGENAPRFVDDGVCLVSGCGMVIERLIVGPIRRST